MIGMAQQSLQGPYRLGVARVEVKQLPIGINSGGNIPQIILPQLPQSP